MKRIAIYPGSFDPPTLAHEDILYQARSVFDEVIVVVALNAQKGPGLLEPLERKKAWETMTTAHIHFAKREDSIVSTAERFNAQFMVRGLRGVSDVEPEQAFRQFVEQASHGLVQVVHFMCRQKYQHVSSSTVRSLVTLTNWKTLARDYMCQQTILVVDDALRRAAADRL